MKSSKHPDSDKLLIKEEPFVAIFPSLAEAIGGHKAAIVQQVHYWVASHGKRRDGHLWTYNSYKQWQAQLPQMKERTVRRMFRELEDEGIVISGNYNRMPSDRRKWYRVDYAELQARVPMAKLATPPGQKGRIGAATPAGPLPKKSQRDSSNTGFQPLGELLPKLSRWKAADE